MDKYDPKTRGDAMRAARKRAGLTLDELKVMAGIPKSTIWRLEKGLNNGNIVTLEILADTLHLSLDEYTGHKIVGKTGTALWKEKSNDDI